MHPANTAASIQSLRRYVRASPPKAQRQLERCKLCSQPLPKIHRHLLEMEERRVVCACDPCALRFHDVEEGRFKLIPRDPHLLPDFHLEDQLWDRFALPINLVFFFESTSVGKVVALYPSPAGATESLLELESWQQLVDRNPELSRLEPDVEALLVNRVGEARLYFMAPMDRCYALAGLIRLHWRGLAGGEVVWNQIAEFFEELKADSRPLPGEVSHA